MLVSLLKSGCRLKNLHPLFFIIFFIVPLQSVATDSNPAQSNVTTVPEIPADDFSVLRFATPELSVHLINQYQPDRLLHPEQWLSWEKKRLQLLENIDSWSQLIDRINSYQQPLPDSVKSEFVLLKARAQLKISHANQVRDAIRALLWSDQDLTTEQVALARRLIIRSYLIEDKAADAQRAMLRYRQDYGESGLQWKRLQAKVLLATGRYQQAVDLLSTENDQSLQVLKNLTRLRAGLEAPSSVYKKSLKAAQQTNSEIGETIRRQYWVLAYIAAGMQNNEAAALEALEQALMTATADTDNDLITINAGLLWQKYQDFALNYANKQHLLVGDDEAWFQQASNLLEKQSLTARALFAYLGVKAAEEQQRHVSLEQLALSIKQKHAHGMILVQQLFEQSPVFASASDIPVRVRYLLLDFALSRGLIKQAANLFKYLPEPPDGEKRLAWNLRRARVLVLGGQYQQAAETLTTMIETESLDQESLNRLMQVVFDFQKVEQHQLALDLFKALYKKNTEANFQRELKFWMAESFQALKDYHHAAQLYLESAMMIAEKQSDPWSSTARYRAANVLSLAGLIDDARMLYQQLLKATKDPNRQAVIKQKLQQLWLIEGKSANELD